MRVLAALRPNARRNIALLEPIHPSSLGQFDSIAWMQWHNFTERLRQATAHVSFMQQLSAATKLEKQLRKVLGIDSELLCAAVTIGPDTREGARRYTDCERNHFPELGMFAVAYRAYSESRRRQR